MMIQIFSVSEMQEYSLNSKKSGKSISLIPTMGYLHNGHKSLMQKKELINTLKITSIFVNPSQFGPNEDFEKYPRNLESDIKLCEEANVDVVFIPKTQEIYPNNFQTNIILNKLPNHLCGLRRVGHFDGVAQVVCKLFNITKADIAIFGQKDYQQVQIIQQMVSDLNMSVKLIRSDIIRDENGLALSSRNSYLNKEELKIASHLYKSLTIAKEQILMKKDFSNIKKEIINYLEKQSISNVEYFSIVNPTTLDDLIEDEDSSILVATAAYVGKTRLIDNILIERNK